MKPYKISEFAAMVGLPQSKIRFYEKYGLFHVKRSENGYRYYTAEDAFRVNAFRMLLLYGFTVEQAIEILDERQSNEEVLCSLKAQRRCLNLEIQLLEYRLKRLDGALELLKSEPGSDFKVVDMEDYLYIAASHGRDFSISVENADLIAQFVELLSITSYTRLIPRADFLDERDRVNPSYVTAIPVSEAYRLPDSRDRRIGHMKLGKCLRYRRRATREESVKKETFRTAFAYLDEHGYKIRDDVVIFPSFLNLDGKGKDVETVVIPVV